MVSGSILFLQETEREVPRIISIVCQGHKRFDHCEHICFSNVSRFSAEGDAGEGSRLKAPKQSAGGGARTHTALRPLDFESSASANSATPAG